VETTLLSFSSQTFKTLLPEKKAFAKYLQPDEVRSRELRRLILIICLAIFLLAVGVRLFHWQDNRPIFPKLFTSMVEQYKSNARLLLNGNITGFITGPSPPGDASILTHPPGYPIIIAAISEVFGESDAAMRLFQIVVDAGAAMLIFLIAAELLPVRAAAITGALAALSPQLTYYSLILIPDAVATLPVLLALYFIIRTKKSNSFRGVVAAGVLVGVSCWLRSNALLLAPTLALVLFLIMDRGRRLRYAATLVAAVILVISPITIRNLVVFHHFIPLSLGAGITLVEGIGEYDKEARFGLPATDLATIQTEAERYHRPDYATSLYGSDGIERERDRTRRGLAVIRSHPVWFAGIVLRRATSILRLERVHRIATTPGVMSRLIKPEESGPVWSRGPEELVGPGLKYGTGQTQVKTSLSSNGQALILEADTPGLNHQIVSSPVPVEKNTDYLLRIPILVEQGSVTINITNAEDTLRYGSTPVLSPLERINPTDQSLDVHEVAFVSRDTNQVSLFLDSADRGGGKTVVRLGTPELFRLGPASFLWTRYVRVLIHNAQRFFITAWIVPLAIFGIALMWLAGRGLDLIVLLAIPAYYLCFQSFLHTEYRYVLAAQPFLYVMVGVTLSFLWPIGRRIFWRPN
jgi:hypothetical protein